MSPYGDRDATVHKTMTRCPTSFPLPNMDDSFICSKRPRWNDFGEQNLFNVFNDSSSVAGGKNGKVIDQRSMWWQRFTSSDLPINLFFVHELHLVFNRIHLYHQCVWHDVRSSLEQCISSTERWNLKTTRLGRVAKDEAVPYGFFDTVMSNYLSLVTRRSNSPREADWKGSFQMIKGEDDLHTSIDLCRENS